MLDEQPFPFIPGAQLEEAPGAEVVVPGQFFPSQGGQSLPFPGMQTLVVEVAGAEVVLPGQFSPSQGQSLPFPGMQAEVVAVQGFPPQQLIPMHDGRVVVGTGALVVEVLHSNLTLWKPRLQESLLEFSGSLTLTVLAPPH